MTLMLHKRQSKSKGETVLSEAQIPQKVKGRPNQLAFLSRAWVLIA